MKKIAAITMSLALMLSLSTVTALALGGGSGAKNKKVTVAVIKAEWCSACQKVDPIMMELMKEYGDRINFVILDVTNEETTAQAAAKAKSLGLSQFFESNKKMTSTVAVFKGKTQTFKTAKNYSRDAYVAAFNKALS